MKLQCKVIEGSKHRYPTIGDYWMDKKGDMQIRTTKFDDSRYAFLILLHEMIEAMICKSRGIDFKAIDEFDIAFENASKVGEPGDELDAPYYHQHQFATIVEMMVARELGVDWKMYNDKCSEVFDKDYAVKE